MSDDTTTWLKKNPSINPQRRTLKTSLRFHVPPSDMNSSIMSNPDKVKDQGLFIPRMMQRSNMQVRKSRAQEFKIPELMVPKPDMKKEGSGCGVKLKKIPSPNKIRKSFLPVAKTKGPSSEKTKTKISLPRPSFVQGVSGRRTTAKRDLIKKVAELSEMKRKEAASQQKTVSGDSSVLRSILKKRASLRRTSQISAKKPKAKKVLFDGFKNSDEEKENDANASLEIPSDFNKALDEPTVFLNFPKGAEIDDSPFEPAKQHLNWTVEETKACDDISSIIKLWESFKEKLNIIQTERMSLEESFESFLQHSLYFQKQYQAYKESSEEMYSTLARLAKEIEEKLQKVMVGDLEDIPKPKRSVGRRESEKSVKIKMSEKSKVIKKSSGRMSVPLLKKELLNDIEDSFSMISKNSFLCK